MNKKGISLLLLSAMLFSVSGCGNTAKRANNNQSSEKKEEKNENKMTIADVDLNDPDLEEKWKKRATLWNKNHFRIQWGTLYFRIGNCTY